MKNIFASRIEHNAEINSGHKVPWVFYSNTGRILCYLLFEGSLAIWYDARNVDEDYIVVARRVSNSPICVTIKMVEEALILDKMK